MKTGRVNIKDLTISFGGALSVPHNIFTAKLVKIPDHILSTMEHECLGGGWVSSNKHLVERLINNKYFVIKDDGKCIGAITAPIISESTVVYPLTNTEKDIYNINHNS